MQVEVFDPFANAAEVLEKHQIHLVTNLSKYEGVVLTVAHDFFKSLDYPSLMAAPNAVLFDTKSILDKKIVTARL